jgi:hypothetical protein
MIGQADDLLASGTAPAAARKIQEASFFHLGSETDGRLSSLMIMRAIQ